jgi:ribulose-bisphosphate carboxylase large chain
LNIYRKIEDIDKSKYFIVNYYLGSKTKRLDKCAWELAIGQSVGNPHVRNQWESDELFENHSCLILENQDELSKRSTGLVKIAFPIINTNWDEDGVSHLLCQIMGGQLDIDGIDICQVTNIEFPSTLTSFKGPTFGIPGIRKYTGVFNKPLLGAIVKPKTGISPTTLGKMVEELVEGGVNFIKEDEILASPSFCSLTDRLKVITPIIKNTNIVYCYCINGDSPFALDRVKQVVDANGTGVHINFWSGLGIYKSIRDLNLPIFVHFQKSGDKILTNKSHNYHIDWNVICKLAGMSGVDFIHAGMLGGYSNSDDMPEVIKTLHSYKVMPALSCGMHPGLVDWVVKQVGNDVLLNCGGAIHGHPGGTIAGAKAMRQAIDHSYDSEYRAAINKWGYVN